TEICPVCKSSTYLNPNMRFLVNPECYHKMCESCVDRIFTHGPAPCPVAGCKRTLRKGKFRPLTFEDIAVEREVDIRRKMAKTFNKREEDFESLRDYNDYLNQVEDITFNLLNGIEIEATNRKIAQYQESNRREIDENEVLAATETNETARALMRKKQAAAAAAQQESMAKEDTGLRFKGLKGRAAAPEPEKPYDPFGGYKVDHSYFVVQDDYKWDWFDMAKKDPQIYAGGYDLKEYYSRTLSDAFAGLAVFVGDEIGGKDKPSDATAATQTAAVAAASSADDIF
ncbi:CDK-activating kinase assembly factor, partial [Rhizodiscina lignyota]